jgi:hypothetical protein
MHGAITLLEGLFTIKKRDDRVRVNYPLRALLQSLHLSCLDHDAGVPFFKKALKQADEGARLYKAHLSVIEAVSHVIQAGRTFEAMVMQGVATLSLRRQRMSATQHIAQSKSNDKFALPDEIGKNKGNSTSMPKPKFIEQGFGRQVLRADPPCSGSWHSEAHPKRGDAHQHLQIRAHAPSGSSPPATRVMLKNSRNEPKEQKAESAHDFCILQSLPHMKWLASNVLIPSAEVFMAKLISREHRRKEVFNPHSAASTAHAADVNRKLKLRHSSVLLGK